MDHEIIFYDYDMNNMHKLNFEWDYTEVNYAGSHQALSSFLGIAFGARINFGHTKENTHTIHGRHQLLNKFLTIFNRSI